MNTASFSTFADRPIRLRAEHFGSPCLQVTEENEHGLSPDRIVSVHGAAADMARLLRAVEAFNAVMAEKAPVVILLTDDGLGVASPSLQAAE